MDKPSVIKMLDGYKWKYKSPLNNCSDCKYLNFIKEKNEITHFCKLYHSSFLGKCPSKITKTGEK